jgi:hypothetical protein
MNVSAGLTDGSAGLSDRLAASGIDAEDLREIISAYQKCVPRWRSPDHGFIISSGWDRVAKLLFRLLPQVVVSPMCLVTFRRKIDGFVDFDRWRDAKRSP